MDATESNGPASENAVVRASDRLRRAEEACQAVPLWLPPWVYKRRLDAAMAEWRQANLELFDAQVGAIGG